MPKQESEKAQRKRERKERKLYEAQVKQSTEKLNEAKTILETVVKSTNLPNYQKAIAVLDNAIELFPENFEAFIIRGNARRDQFVLDEAIDDYTKASELNAAAYGAYEGRATCFELLRDYDRAMQDYTTIISIHPENDHAYNMRGACMLKKRPQGLLLKEADYTAVVNDFKTALKLNEFNYHARTNLGKAHSDQRKYREAIQCFTDALRICETYRYANYRRACAYISLANELEREVDRYNSLLEARRKKIVTASSIAGVQLPPAIAAAAAASPLLLPSSSPTRSPQRSTSPAPSADTQHLSGSGANAAKKRVLMGRRVETYGEDDADLAGAAKEFVSLEDRLEAAEAQRKKCLTSAVADLLKVIDVEKKNLEITAVIQLANCYYDLGEDELATKEYHDALAAINTSEAEMATAGGAASMQAMLNQTSMSGLMAAGGASMLGGTFSGTMSSAALSSTLAMGSVMMAAPLGDVTMLRKIINSRLEQLAARKNAMASIKAASSGAAVDGPAAVPTKAR